MADTDQSPIKHEHEVSAWLAVQEEKLYPYFAFWLHTIFGFENQPSQTGVY